MREREGGIVIGDFWEGAGKHKDCVCLPDVFPFVLLYTVGC